jgi:hypothetical protein
MAKNDNLGDFLTDIANAIREKKGTSGPINAQDFSGEIASIETGGGGGAVAVAEGDVNFRDYDGTILHSFSKEQFLALSALPELPTQPGLICQEWNYTIEDAKAYVSEYGVLDIGATYITDDGKTRFYISVIGERKFIKIAFHISNANSLIIDWGDGSIESISASGNMTRAHTYSSVKDYVITFNIAEGAYLSFTGTSSAGVITSPYNSMVKKIEFGARVRIYNYAFRVFSKISSITLPNNVTSIGSHAFYNCYLLNYVVIPSGVTSIESNTFYQCNAISGVSLPKTIISIGASAFSTLRGLRYIIIPQDVTSIVGNAFYASGLCWAVLPKGLKSINSVFSSCASLAYLDFRAFDSIPSLSASDSLSGIASDCNIVVPDALYDEWIAATNWSLYASKIVKASEFNG